MRKPRTFLFAALLLSLAAGCAHSGASAPGRYVHFCVVPRTLPDGSDAAPRIEAFKIWLCEKAGGYTEIPSAPGGWVNPGGELETAEQAGFLVSSPACLTRDIAEYVAREFRETHPYVIAWKALP